MSIHYISSGSIGALTVTSSFVVPTFSSDPAGEEGSVYFNTTDKHMKMKTDVDWTSAGESGTSGSSGSATSNGTNGTSGIHSTSGTSGGGESGSGGTSGTAGNSPAVNGSGSSGSSGISGTSGTSGTSGSSGSSGLTGTGGSSGTSGITFAVQSDQETATSTTVAVNPGVQAHHPSAAKFWIIGGAGLDVTTIYASYNITSWLDSSGVGQGILNNDFSSTSWAGYTTVLDGTLAWDATYTTHQGFTAQATGSFVVTCGRMQDGNTATATVNTPDRWMVMGFGDQ